MAGRKLNAEQQSALLKWLAADYDTALIQKWFEERDWPKLSHVAISYYRTRYSDDVETVRKERRFSALNRGLALKEERVARLCRHADELEAIKWEPDDKGRLWNEKAWRETLADIAAEMGERRVGLELSWKEQLEKHGIPASELFSELVAFFAARLAAQSAPVGADGSGGDSRGGEVSGAAGGEGAAGGGAA